MSQYTHTLEVERPVRTVYDQWTQFESFPEFMDGVSTVRQLDDTHTSWDVEIAGVERHFDATIVEQRPDERVAWTTTDGAYHAGEVRFEPMAADRTRVTLEMDFEPDGVTEKAGELIGVVGSRVKGDLERFKEFIEDRGAETGAWRGTVEDGAPRPTNPGSRGTGFDAEPG